MITRLAIRDLVVIAGAEIDPGPGLTAITGETGAGKTVLAQALGLLAGAPADQKAVRPGARFALVEATIALPPGFWDALDEDDPARELRSLVESEDEVVVARRIPAEGRARSLVDGQAAPRAGVASLVAALVRFSGQHAQRRLVSPAHQLSVLDGFAGAPALRAAGELAAHRRELRAAERALADCDDRRARAQRERDGLALLVEDVAAVGPSVEELAALRGERDRLRHYEHLAEGLNTACRALADEDDQGAINGVGVAAAAVKPLGAIVPELDDLAGRLASAQDGLQELLHELRAELDRLEANPGRLDEIEERMGAYLQLDRRYGPGIELVIERARAAAEALELLERGDADDAALRAECERVRALARDCADNLNRLRRDAARPLAGAVVAQLADLGMGSAELRVEVTRDDNDPPSDRATFWLRANPGLPEGALADTASGGELSRVLLALQTVAASSGEAETWVFDEVDAGIGGVTASAVAAKLAELGRSKQVLVITHLPQVAAAAGRHYRLVKGTDDGGLTRTTIEPIAGESLLDELCRMLGSSPDDEGARRHATELLERRQDDSSAPKVTVRKRAAKSKTP